MKKTLVIASIGLLLSTAAFADVEELSQSELRAAVSEKRAIPTRSLVAGVENFTNGEVVDIRAFVQDNLVIYRILYRGEDGGIGTLLVDGSTGRSVNAASQIGQEIAAMVGANPGRGSLMRSNGVGNGRNNGNNGRGNENRGGGGGNSGGNGNGGGRDR